MTETSLVTETVFDSWDAARNELVKLAQWGFVFRGQQDERWALAPTLERSESLYRDVDERRVFDYFSRRAAPLLPAAVNTDASPTVAWLSLLQHYGGPTRLLDFTRSPYVGAFFALEAPNDEGRPHAVWAIHPQRLQQWAARALVDAWNDVPTLERATTLVQDQQETLVATSVLRGRSLDAIFPVEPFNFDSRQSSQQSLFLFAGSTARPFMDVLDGLPSDDWPFPQPRLAKLVLPDAVRDEALDDLWSMNVTPASLFPGLDGLGRTTRLLVTRTNLENKAIRNALNGFPLSFGLEPLQWPEGRPAPPGESL